jgi:hypothetical protein
MTRGSAAMQAAGLRTGDGGHMSAPNYDPLFYWVRERELIRLRKAHDGARPPFTGDEILSTYRFCNVRREDDRVTIWIRQNIRERFAGHPLLWLMLCIARQINWPDTLAELIGGWGSWPDGDGFAPHRLTAALNARKTRGEKLYTGAYMISAPASKGADKQAYIAETVIGALWERRATFRATTLQRTHEWITRSNGWGPFMAYQASSTCASRRCLPRRRRRDLGGGRARHAARAEPAARPAGRRQALAGSGAVRDARHLQGRAAADRRCDGFLRCAEHPV